MQSVITPMLMIFNYEFMQNAFLAGTIAAVVAALVGYFMIMRNLAFAGHALSHIGFAGAAGAGLIGLSPLMGQLILTVLAGTGMGAMGNRIGKSDMVIGIILAFSLGLGVLFLHFYNSYAGQAMTILFGDLLGVSKHQINLMLLFSIPCLLALAIIARPLLFASLEPELAEAKGVSLPILSMLFFIIISIAVTEASQVVGVLLVFTLLIGPAATALNLTCKVSSGVVLTVLLAILIVWLGIILSYLTDWPSTFWISALSLVSYLLSAFWNKCQKA